MKVRNIKEFPGTHSVCQVCELINIIRPCHGRKDWHINKCKYELPPTEFPDFT